MHSGKKGGREGCTGSERVLMAVLFQETMHEWEEMKEGC